MGDLIAFFDVETTVPSRPGQPFFLLEFGLILVCPRSLAEVDHFSSLIRPADLTSVSSKSVRCNGITRDALAHAPTFEHLADQIYNLLHGRVWAGHNIIRFDCVRIREAFAKIGRPPPEPKGTIDSLSLLTQKFGRRAGNMKMATLATYFGLGEQKHRSLDDVRMNLEVVKYCATVLFLESSLPEVLMTNNWVGEGAAARNSIINTSQGRSCSNQKSLSELEQENCEKFSSPKTNSLGDISTHDTTDTPSSRADNFNLVPLIELMKIDPHQPDLLVDEKMKQDSPNTHSSRAALSEIYSGYAGALDPNEVVTNAITASAVPAYHGGPRIVLLHKDVILHLCCMKLKVRFHLSAKYQDHAGRPRLSIVVDAPPSLCGVLDVCERVAQKLLVESGSSSEWRPVVTRKDSFPKSSTIRLHIPTIASGEGATYAPEIYKKATCGSIQRLVFGSIDVAELVSLFIPGTFIDTCFKLDTYDYQQNAGMRLVTECLIVHSK